MSRCGPIVVLRSIHDAALRILYPSVTYDDSSADCLDNRELKRVLQDAHQSLGRKVDLVGMDACLMTMLEVAYQIRDHAQILVGSEETEPGNGWPHDLILRDLTARSAMSAAELATTVVRRYVESYRHTGQEATQSAIDLAKLDDLVEAVDALARRLLAALPSPALEAALHAAWRRTLRFFDNMYVDLHHFAGNLAAATDVRAIKQACVDVQRAIEGKGAKSRIIAEGHIGQRLQAARGSRSTSRRSGTRPSSIASWTSRGRRAGRLPRRVSQAFCRGFARQKALVRYAAVDGPRQPGGKEATAHLSGKLRASLRSAASCPLRFCAAPLATILGAVCPRFVAQTIGAERRCGIAVGVVSRLTRTAVVPRRDGERSTPLAVDSYACCQKALAGRRRLASHVGGAAANDDAGEGECYKGRSLPHECSSVRRVKPAGCCAVLGAARHVEQRGQVDARSSYLQLLA